MSEIHATADASATADEWIDLREPSKRTARVVRKKGTRARIDGDASVAFALFVTMLFIPQLETAGAALFTLISIGYALWRLKHLSAVLMSRAILLPIPALAVLSTLWSDEPLLTLKYSLELVLTVVAALLLSAAPRPKRIIEGIFLAFAVHTIVSLGFGQTVDVGANGDTAFSGLSDSKNLLADTAATGFLISLGVFFIGIEDRKFSRCAAALFVSVAQIYMILIARSAGAMVSVSIAAILFLAFLILDKATFSFRATVLGVLGFCLAFIALAYDALSEVVADLGTRYFDKDTTLTGRTYLWQRAGDLINEKPVLGRGFHAFWYQGNPDAEGMWRYMGIRSESGFNFHNTFIELLVHLGWLGAVVCVLCFLVALGFLVLRFVRRPTLPICFWLGMIAYQCVRMPIETIAPGEFSTSTIFILIALGCALGSEAMGQAQLSRFKARSASSGKFGASRPGTG